MTDSWMDHLKKHGLLELHNEAQKFGYRVRVANGYIFDLEYEGGITKLYGPEWGLKRFQDSDQGREEARAFLTSTKDMYPYVWLVNAGEGKVAAYCQNPYIPSGKPYRTLTKQETIEAIKRGDFPNKCGACDEKLV